MQPASAPTLQTNIIEKLMQLRDEAYHEYRSTLVGEPEEQKESLGRGLSGPYTVITVPRIVRRCLGGALQLRPRL